MGYDVDGKRRDMTSGIRSCINTFCALLSLAVPMMGGAHAAEGFLCVANLSTGFRWSGSAWEVATFTVADDKFLVRSVPEFNIGSTRYNYKVTKLGEPTPRHDCWRGEYNGIDSTVILCGGLGMGFQMRTDTLRFQENYGLGYLDGDAPGNTPYLTIGKCSKFD